MPRCAIWLPVLLTACASTPAPTAFQRGLELAPLAADEFPGAAGLLPGIGALRDVPDWLPEERVLYGIRLQREGRLQRWLVRLQVLRPTVPQSTLAPLLPGGGKLHYELEDGEQLTFESTWIEVGVEVFDAEGHLLRSSKTQAAGDLLRLGLVDACDRAGALLAREPGRKVTSHPEEKRAIARGVVALLSFLEIARTDESLSPILWEAVEKPSALAVIADLGVKLGLTVQFEQAEAGVALEERPGFRVPATLLVNGAPGLHCRFLVTEPMPPLRLGAGIVALEAVRPHDASTRVQLQLFGAQLPRPVSAR